MPHATRESGSEKVAVTSESFVHNGLRRMEFRNERERPKEFSLEITDARTLLGMISLIW